MEEKKLVPKRRLSGFSDEWREKELNNLGFFGRTYSFSRSKEGKGKYHHIHYGDIHTNNLGVINKNSRLPTIKEEGAFELLKQGDIVIADASEDYKDLGKTTVIGETAGRKIIAGLHTFKFTPNENLCPVYYLYYSQSRIFKKFSYKTGTGISVFGISKDNLGKMKLYIPTYREQQKIGEFFKVLDERIANQERKIAKIKALKSAYFTEMFPQEGETVPRRRFKGFTGIWNYRLLKEVITSEFKGKAKAEMIGGNSPYLDTNYLNGGEITYVNLPKDVKKDDVLILWDGSQAGMVYHGFEGALGSTLKAYKPKYSGEFLYQFLKKNQKVIFEQYRTPNIPHVINTFVDEFWICIPSIEEQQKIGDFFKNLDNQITTEEKKLEKLKKTKDAYLEEMFV